MWHVETSVAAQRPQAGQKEAEADYATVTVQVRQLETKMLIARHDLQVSAQCQHTMS